MKIPCRALRLTIVATSALGVWCIAAATPAATGRFAEYPPEIATAMEQEQAAFTEATQAAGAKWSRAEQWESAWIPALAKKCVDSRPDTNQTDMLRWLATHAVKQRCWLEWTHTRTRKLQQLTQAARAGNIPDELLIELSQPDKILSPPAVVNPLAGANAKIERAGASATLTYTDNGGAQHKYAVARPKFAQGMMQGDTGGWMYVAPDHKSGVMFNLTADGQVSGQPANPVMLQMMSGQ